MYNDDSTEICSFDDLIVTAATRGVVTLSCPVCGTVGTSVVRTLSDLTNGAIEHLEKHPEARRHARLVAAA